VRAGFSRVVFVIRRDFEALFREKIGARYAGKIEVAYAFQSVDTLPVGFAPIGGREKPWGTGHAVWCAREAVTGNFAVVNADDFYGADSFRRLGEFLRTASGEMKRPATFAMVGFRLANTLSEHGTVSRGVCAVAPDGSLQSIVEQTSIAPVDVGPGRKLSGDEIVSMNCWGFTPALFAELDVQFSAFMKTVTEASGTPAASRMVDPMKAEFYLPAAVSTMIGRREAKVTVLPTDSSWFGITYRDDKPRVAASIADLVRTGRYPAKLF
jgi:NDP-sugar pyrophosphorylase family protein